MKKIQLGHHQKRKYKYPLMYALVDNEDYDELNKHKWYAHYDPVSKTFYAVRYAKLQDIGYKNGGDIKMHAFIMKPPKGMVTDHSNHDTLDNRKKNLRVCTYSENRINSRIRKDNTSGYKGVSKAGRKKDKWRAYINYNGKILNLGTFTTKEDAHEAYKTKSDKIYGKFSYY